MREKRGPQRNERARGARAGNDRTYLAVRGLVLVHAIGCGERQWQHQRAYWRREREQTKRDIRRMLVRAAPAAGACFAMSESHSWRLERPSVGTSLLSRLKGVHLGSSAKMRMAWAYRRGCRRKGEESKLAAGRGQQEWRCRRATKKARKPERGKHEMRETDTRVRTWPSGPGTQSGAKRW